MNDPRQHHRQAIRAAVRIHEHLNGPASRADLEALPQGRWNELRQIHERLQLAQRRGWQAASRLVVNDLEYQIRRLTAELGAVREGLPQPEQHGFVCPASAIAADLLALNEEFEAVRIDLKQKTVQVHTAGIVLEDIDLGAFRIVLHWDRVGVGKAYQIWALQPNCPVGKSNVIHPHVESHTLCEGAGAPAIRKALASGRLLDFFVLVRQILETYNGSSPYVALSDWSGTEDVNCADCGCCVSSDDASSCERCEARVCSDCETTCQDCGHYLCSECSFRCADCSDAYCRSCLLDVPAADQLICESCHQQREETEDEDNQCEPDTTDAVCLGEAAVPA